MTQMTLVNSSNNMTSNVNLISFNLIRSILLIAIIYHLSEHFG